MSADARLDAFERLLTEVSTMLADFLSRADQRDTQHDGASESVATALAELVDLLKKHRGSPDAGALVQALKALKLEPHFHVPPAQVVFQPAPPAPAQVVTYEVLIPGRYGAVDQRMTITRTERTEPHG